MHGWYEAVTALYFSLSLSLHTHTHTHIHTHTHTQVIEYRLDTLADHFRRAAGLSYHSSLEADSRVGVLGSEKVGAGSERDLDMLAEAHVVRARLPELQEIKFQFVHAFQPLHARALLNLTRALDAFCAATQPSQTRDGAGHALAERIRRQVNFLISTWV